MDDFQEPPLDDDCPFADSRLTARAGVAGVVVLQNWTPFRIQYTLRLADGRESRQSIAPTDIASIPTTGPIVIALGEDPAAQPYLLGVNSVHYFCIRNGAVQVVHLKLPGVDDSVPAATQPTGQNGQPASNSPPGNQRPANPAQPGQPPAADVSTRSPWQSWTTSPTRTPRPFGPSVSASDWMRPPTYSNTIAECGSKSSRRAIGIRPRRSVPSIRPCWSLPARCSPLRDGWRSALPATMNGFTAKRTWAERTAHRHPHPYP